MSSDEAATTTGDAVVIIDPGSGPIIVIDPGDSTVIVDIPDSSEGIASTTTTTTTARYEFSQSLAVSAVPTPHTVTVTDPSFIRLLTQPSSSSFTVVSTTQLTRSTSSTSALRNINVLSSDCFTTTMATATTTSVDTHASFTAIMPVIGLALVCQLAATAGDDGTNPSLSSSHHASNNFNTLTLVLGVLCILFGLVVILLGITIWRRRRRSTQIESTSKAAHLDVEHGAGARYMKGLYPGPAELHDAPTVNGETDANQPTEKRSYHSFEGYERATFVSEDATVGGPHAPTSEPHSPPPLTPLASIPASEPMKHQALPPPPSAFRRHRERDGGVRVAGDPEYTNRIEHRRHSSIQSYGAVSRMSDSNASTLPPSYETRYSR